MLDKAPTALSDPTAFKQWMVRNEEVLDAAFDKSHVDNLYLMADAAERVLITGIGRGKGVTDEDIVTRFTSALGTTPAGISNRFIAVQEGRLGSKAMVGYILSRAIRQQSGVRSDALFREAMFDPDIARLLTTEGSESVPPLGISEPNKRRLNAFLFNIGVDYGDGITGEGAKETLILEPNITDQPILQTPPFPEYTSGHSVVSGAASVILTSIFGEDFAFDDDTEVPYGLPIRSFVSFKAAADEAAISRMYGGIHYRAAVEIGVEQGRSIGKLVVDQLGIKTLE